MTATQQAAYDRCQQIMADHDAYMTAKRRELAELQAQGTPLVDAVDNLEAALKVVRESLRVLGLTDPDKYLLSEIQTFVNMMPK